MAVNFGCDVGVVVVDVVVDLDVVVDGDGDGDDWSNHSVQPGTWVPFQTRHMGYVAETSGGEEDVVGVKVLRPGPA